MSRADDAARAEHWQVLAFSAIRTRDMCRERGWWQDADLYQREYLRRARRARDWQVRADAPWWKRWFR